ncbi:MAG: glutathione S-transferase family protein [Rhodospirillaceae bacterium]|jgi:glutathione S-transferase|nr:glutathione S-transferase family protein [Rhodospirillaceae bacterium]MBT5562994.1 glutathione S-transferase family protein [Rhodospirillaceae bacterium]MBT6242670.1 glutathione S-transferase family protein [Rhodospirillaceae bacterium]MBT7137399.1 glutathione S-transferase family protein [Rhodospirillaceae bacterium]
MQTLYHLWLNPFCRKVRIVLHEKKIDFDLKVENVWERRREFLALNPAGDVPVLVETGGTALSGSDVISEFMDEIHPEPPLVGRHPLERAEVRRLVAWFDRKFNDEVTENLVGEKVMKRFLGLGAPDSKAIRAGHNNIHTHLSYISYLIERRKWLAGNELTLADIAAAAHLSTIDYLGDVPWAEHQSAKDWYARIKSRPSFRPLLSDHIPGAPPSKHYANLDF